MTERLSECPICKAEIHATIKQYREECAFSFDPETGYIDNLDIGREVYPPENEGDLVGDRIRFYCQNDHSEIEMMTAAASQRREAL